MEKLSTLVVTAMLGCSKMVREAQNTSRNQVTSVRLDILLINFVASVLSLNLEQ
jgi:hypothetical protein